MGKTLLRSLVFAGAVVGVSLALDLLVTVLYQGGPVPGAGRRFIVFRTALHGATFVFTAIGAAIGFAFLGSHTISYGRIASLGAALGVVTLAAAIMGVRGGAYWAILGWLIVGSALVSFFGAKVLASKEGK
ncbi:MAG: hypothetical protein EPO20_12490 [Betaproteobacteria bacterium]|nr:MAG: hypothetical protein EPO20_12490 [Betaproteobacteria bacterium]